MELVPGFMALLQGLSATMTTPTFHSLVTVLTGWVFASRRTVTRMILAAGASADKHYSSYHRLFSSARWSPDTLGLALFHLVEPFLGDVVMLGLDNTLARKRGLLQWPWPGAFQEPFTLDLGLLSQECADLIRECPIFTPDLSDTLGTCTAVEPQQLIEQWAEQDPACLVDVGSHDSRSTSCR